MNMSVPEIATELMVDAVVEATVMCLGDSICLQVRVISAFPEEKQLWIADYKEEKSQILNLYNRITKQIAEEVKITLTPDEALTQGQLALDLDPLNPLMQVLYSALLLCVDDCETALAHLETVVAIDPEHFLANNVIEIAAFRCKEYDKAFEAVKFTLPIDKEAAKQISRNQPRRTLHFPTSLAPGCPRTSRLS